MVRMLAVICCLVCILSLGCGPGGPALGTVTGTVTLDGEPVTNGLVTFSPSEGGRSSIGKTDSAGKYELIFADRKGAMVGSHQVAVTTVQESSGSGEEVSSDSDAYAQQAMGGSASDYDNATVTEPIPAKYNSETTLTFDVASGSNTIDIPMTTGE
jgi:hypothetical protein